MKVIIIAAVAANNAIGKDNKLLWRIPADMKFFKDKTFDHCVVSGRKNYESIPEKFRPLPGRVNIIVSRNVDYVQDGALTVHSIQAGIDEAKLMNESECFIIGGAEIYAQSMDLADEMFITHIEDSYVGDAFFPEIDNSKWNRTSIYAETDKLKNNFEIYHYTKKHGS